MTDYSRLRWLLVGAGRPAGLQTAASKECDPAMTREMRAAVTDSVRRSIEGSMQRIRNGQ